MKTPTYKVSDVCSQCGQAIKWYAEVQCWLHEFTFLSSCSRRQTPVASPKVEVR